jgi:6-phosphogluconolactonase
LIENNEKNMHVFADAAALAGAVAELIVAGVAAAPTRFALNLSGGSTPKRLYERLASPAFRDRIEWPKLHLFWGDERFVPADHPDSNYRMTKLAMLDHVPLPSAQIHPVPTDAASPEICAADYARTLQTYYGGETLDATRPLFDMTLLGLGPDGHTASLFPNTAALQEHEAWVTSIVGAKPEPRISLTYPVLESSRIILFLVAGADKHDVLTQVLAHEPWLPAAKLAPLAQTHWYVDEAAAAKPSK